MTCMSFLLSGWYAIKTRLARDNKGRAGGSVHGRIWYYPRPIVPSVPGAGSYLEGIKLTRPVAPSRNQDKGSTHTHMRKWLPRQVVGSAHERKGGGARRSGVVAVVITNMSG